MRATPVFMKMGPQGSTVLISRAAIRYRLALDFLAVLSRYSMVLTFVSSIDVLPESRGLHRSNQICWNLHWLFVIR